MRESRRRPPGRCRPGRRPSILPGAVMASLELSPSSQDFIRKAAEYLENPSFFVRLANAVGKPLENAARAAPEKVARVVNTALEKTMQAALFTVDTGGN